MPSSPASTSKVLPNPDALHKVFDAEFQGLLSQARQELGDAISLAPRVAEGAFVRAWDARSRLQSTDELKQFLRDDVKNAAARALARRKTIMEGGDDGQISLKTAEHVAAATAIDPKLSWSHIVQAIHLDPQSAASDKKSAEDFRHDTAERLDHATRSKLSGKVVLAIGAAIVIVALAAVMSVNKISKEAAYAEAIASNVGRVTASPNGQIGKMTLADGSEVTLAPDSKLFVPTDFGDNVRPVKLDGAASFKVASGKQGDFRVYMRNAVIMAQGTSFVVSGRMGDTAVVVKVTEGAVNIKVGKGPSTLVQSPRTVLVESAGNVRDATADEAEEAASWAEGSLAMINRPLRDVLPQLLRWFNVDVGVRDLKLLDRPATLRAKLDSSSAAVAAVAKSVGLTVITDGGHTVLVDQGAKPAPKK